MDNVIISVEVSVKRSKGFADTKLVAGNTQKVEGEFSLKEALSQVRAMQREVKEKMAQQLELLIEKEREEAEKAEAEKEK